MESSDSTARLEYADHAGTVCGETRGVPAAMNRTLNALTRAGPGAQAVSAVFARIAVWR